MPSASELRVDVLRLLDQARSVVPRHLVDRLPASERLGGAPEWHPFEHELWRIGEAIRQLLQQAPRLRADPVLQHQIQLIATDRRAHRGRQPFVMLLGYRACAAHGPIIAQELDDPAVQGQVISTLYRMRAPGHSARVGPFLDHEKAWIRNEAKRYIAWDQPVD